MIELMTSLALSSQDPCSGWESDRLVEDFNACLSGEWGEEEGCTEGQTISYETGLTNPAGYRCLFDYMQWDPHTGGFRLFYGCTNDKGESTGRDGGVWIVNGNVLLTGTEVIGFEPTLYRCEASEE